MATVAIAIAAIVATALVVREVMTRRRVAVLEREIELLRTQSRDAEQLASMGQLVSGLAQELKSPLQGVIGNTELMIAAGVHDGDELRNIQENAVRAAGLVRNLLAFTETGALHKRWQDVNDLVRRAVEYSRGELATLGVRVSTKAGERVPLVYVDGRQLEKVVSTLLLRHTGRTTGQSTIVVSTFRRAANEGARRADQDDRLVIEIQDETAADSGEELAWSPDVAACRQIVLAHGGSLEVTHPPDGGTVFQLELPLTATVLGDATGSDQHG